MTYVENLARAVGGAGQVLASDDGAPVKAVRSYIVLARELERRLLAGRSGPKADGESE